MEKIPFVDFGGSGPLLHFAHSNGFPPGCFRQMLAPLTAAYHVVAIKHRPLWPGSRPEELTNWEVVQGDLARFFAQQGYQGVIGVGHSLGAVSTMMAAWRHPALFRALVLIEPVFLPPAILQLIAKDPDGAAQMPLVKITRKRRNYWPDRQAAFAHLRPKPVFARWSDQVLWDYVREALREKDDGGLTLAYSREWEARFYALPPQTVWEEIPKVTQPTLAIRGAESDTLSKEAWDLWQERQPDAQFIEIPDAGHMVTMERPGLLAKIISDYLNA